MSHIWVIFSIWNELYRFLIKYCAVNESGRVCWRISHILMDSVTQNGIWYFVFSVGRHHFHLMKPEGGWISLYRWSGGVGERLPTFLIFCISFAYSIWSIWFCSFRLVFIVNCVSLLVFPLFIRIKWRWIAVGGVFFLKDYYFYVFF